MAFARATGAAATAAAARAGAGAGPGAPTGPGAGEDHAGLLLARRWRDSAASIIALQAVTLALGELDRLAPEDRPPAIERGAVLIDLHERVLRELWGAGAGGLAGELALLVGDARAALHRARGRG